MINTNLLEIENDEKILEYTDSKNTPIWMFMRRPVLYNIMQSKLLGANVLFSSRKNSSRAIKYILMSSLQNIKYSRFTNDERQIMFYTMSRGEMRNGKFVNQYTDDIALSSVLNSITIEHPPCDWGWIKKRANYDVLYNAMNLSISFLRRKISKEECNSIDSLLDIICYRLKEFYNIILTQGEIDNLRLTTIKEMHAMNSHAIWVNNIACKYKVKVAIFVGSSYSRNYPIIRALKERGIVTVDLQHGFLTKNNTVYNYAESIRDNPIIKDGTPNYFLAYGKWWMSQTNMPFDSTYIIGNPYRERKVQSYIYKRPRNKIVLIGCANNTKSYIDLANNISKITTTYEVIFRPHPTERETVKSISNSCQLFFKLDLDTDLYRLFEETEVIISEISTVLFESVGLVPRRLVWRTKFSVYNLPDCPFETFCNIEELNDKISKKRDNIKIVSDEDIWSKEWKANFDYFLQDVLS